MKIYVACFTGEDKVFSSDDECTNTVNGNLNAPTRTVLRDVTLGGRALSDCLSDVSQI